MWTYIGITDMTILAEYKTSDLVIASVLKTSGKELTTIEMKGMRGIFVFKDVEQSFLNDIDMGNVLVEPNDFHNTTKQLTSIVRRKQQN